MNLITNNPYRTIGILVGATAAEQRRQFTRLQRFLEADQEPEDDYSFPALGKVHRTIDIVNQASSKLTLDDDKMSAALFWFYIGYPITDKPAFDAIKEGDLDQALSIWTKRTSTGEVSQRNASAFSNLGTLYLSGILNGTYTKEALLEKGISLKLKFLESDFFKDFKALATDEKTYKKSKKELQLLFLNLLQTEIEKNGVINLNKFIDIITKQEFSAKEDFLKAFVEKPIEQIEKKIEEAKAKRKANKANAVNIGKALFDETSENIKQIKSILGDSNLNFSSISDKVSNEILQCGIDYFSHYKDSSTDPGSPAMDLCRKAKTLAVGNIAKQRCQENTVKIEEWIDDKPERDKQKLIREDLNFITSKLEAFQNRSDTIENVRDLLDSCKPKLTNIRASLGRTDELYLKLSSAIVSNILGMLVTAVNDEQELFKYNVYESLDFSQKVAEIAIRRNCTLTSLYKSKEIARENLKTTLKSAIAISTALGQFDMDSNLKRHYSTNHSTLISLGRQLGVDSSSSPPSSIFSDIWPYLVIAAGVVIGSIANSVTGLIAGAVIGLMAVGLIRKMID